MICGRETWPVHRASEVTT